jgi:hypothetical protein
MVLDTLRRLAAGATIVALGACAAFAPGGLPPGTPIAQARSALGLTGEHPLPGGGTRLEFAQGAFGKQTFMLDFDAAGRLVRSEQVLTEANFATITPGTTADEIRRRFGRPVWIFRIGWQRLTVWNYRFPTGDCVWYQVSIDDSQRVRESGIGPDPACDGPSVRD